MGRAFSFCDSVYLMTRDEEWLLKEKYGGVATHEYDADCRRLAAGEPLAYVIGHQPFLGLTICLDSHPLIPRPETEWWTSQLIQESGGGIEEASGGDSEVFRRATARGTAIFQQKNTRPPEPATRLRILDLCAGSGAIGCATLKYLPHAEVYFGEIDPAHEATILKNIRQNGLDESRTHIGIGDLFTPFESMPFDIIAANPPYIPESRELDKSVIEYEPELALRSGSDGLDLIRRIAHELPKHLKPSGIAWIECDRAHAQAACALFADQGFSAQVRADQYGTPRLIVVSFPHA